LGPIFGSQSLYEVPMPQLEHQQSPDAVGVIATTLEVFLQ
jgi:hypothetical protein